MSTSQKKIGDRIRITAGQNKDQIGTLVDKERRGWKVELADGQHITVPFPQVQLFQEDALVEPTNANAEQSEINADGEVTVHFSIADINRAKPSSETPASTETIAEACETEQTDSSDGEAVTHEASESERTDTSDITKLNVKGLQALAKSKGIAIARTRDDFLRIILQKNPEADPGQLRGKILFDTVSQMHISRLRTKQDLLNLLA